MELFVPQVKKKDIDCSTNYSRVQPYRIKNEIKRKRNAITKMKEAK